MTTPLAGLEIGGATVAVGETLDQFGFATLEPVATGWRLTVRDVEGSVLRECTLAGDRVICP